MHSQDKGHGVSEECLEGATEVQLDKELPEEKPDPLDKVFSAGTDIRCKTIKCESGPACIRRICARDGKGDSCGKWEMGNGKWVEWLTH